MSKRGKAEVPTRSAPKVQNKEPPRPTIFARVFPILVIISAVVLYIVTLPEEPIVTSSPPQDTNEKSFSQYKEGAALLKILSGHYKTADVKLKSLTTLSNPSKPSNQNTGHIIKKLSVSVSSDKDKDKSVHLIAKEFGSYVHPRNVTWTPRVEINPSTLEYCSERAVLQALNSVAHSEKQIWPAYIGSDDTSGIIVSEHLSSSMTLCDVLKKERSLLTEELFAKFGETLADFHRSTQDKARDFDQLISTATYGHMDHDETLEEDLEVFVQSREVLDELLPALGVSKVSNFETELDNFEKELKQLTQRRKSGLNSKSDPFYMLAHGDLCPDNVLLRYDKAQKHIDHIYFVDYSRSGIRNIFYDVTFMRMTFPTCWCIEKLPMNFIKAFERAYISRWTSSITPAQFSSQMTKWSLFHAITTIADLLPRVWEKDMVLSGYSLRQRIVDRIDAYLMIFDDVELQVGSSGKSNSASLEQLKGLSEILKETWKMKIINKMPILTYNNTSFDY